MRTIRLTTIFILLCTTITIAAQKRIKVSCVGNSITYGATLTDRETQSYPAQLQQMLGNTYEVKNFGKSGATLLNKGHRPYTRQAEYQQAIDFAGDIVVIHLGINDTDPRDWPDYRDSFVKDYLSLIDSFRQANPTCKIMIARLTPIADRHPRFESGTRDWHDQIQLAIETVARYAGVQLIDFHEPLYPYPFILTDAVHPNAEGAKILAKTVYSAITGDYGGLQLSELYTDKMVLQHNCPLTIRGIANAGNKITVSIAGQQQTTKAASNGKWQVTLQPLKAGGPYTLTIRSDKQKLQYQDVLAGEVWLCSGQSNMEFMLRAASTAKQDISNSDNTNIRLFDMKARWRTNAVEWESSTLDSLNHLQYYAATKWEICDPKTAASFSAVAYYFGKMLQDSLQIPVGLICNAIGGSPTEAWIERSTLEYHFPTILRDWKKNDFIQDWVRGRAILNVKKSTDKLQRHPYEPCYLYEAGIRPLEQYPIKGVIWYQGESNAHNYEAHEKLFKLLINSWRKNWENENLPFYYVQLSSIDRPSWPWFRDSQRRMMNEIPCTGMAVSSDHGDSLNVHPTNKKPVGERLARWALNKTYNKSQVFPSGPLFRHADFCEDTVYITFDYADGLSTSDGSPVRTFEVAETEGVYYPAIAEIEAEEPEIKIGAKFEEKKGVKLEAKHEVNSEAEVEAKVGTETDARIEIDARVEIDAKVGKEAEEERTPKSVSVRIKVYSDQVKHPRYVRYGWQPFTRANLINKAGLPASTFRAEAPKSFIESIRLQKMNGFPKSEKGINQGVSACYAGILNRKLLIAGGCNFPGTPASEGGKKKYYQGIYAAEMNPDTLFFWNKVGELPMPAAYGVSVSCVDGIICAGGMNEHGALTTVYKIQWNEKKGKISLETLPDLPYALDNMYGTLVGNQLFITGGNRNGKPSNSFLCLDLDNLAAGWQQLPDFPGAARVQPVCAGQYKNNEVCIYLWGGFAASTDGKPATLSTDGYCYSSASRQWTPVATPTGNNDETISLGGGTAIAISENLILCTGGVNKDIFLAALQHPEKDYLLHPAEWYKFNDRILIYNIRQNTWQEVARNSQTARAGAALTGWDKVFYNINGELKPGIRTPEIIKITIE